MIKKKPYGDTLKEQLLAGARDRLYNFLLSDGAIRGVILNGTRMVNEMRANHELGILETLVLGRAYLDLGLFLKAKKRTKQAKECITRAIEIFVQSEANIYLKHANEALESLK